MAAAWQSSVITLQGEQRCEQIMKIIQIYRQMVTAMVKYVNGGGLAIFLAISLITTADVIGRFAKHPIPGLLR